MLLKESCRYGNAPSYHRINSDAFAVFSWKLAQLRPSLVASCSHIPRRSFYIGISVMQYFGFNASESDAKREEIK